MKHFIRYSLIVLALLVLPMAVNASVLFVDGDPVVGIGERRALDVFIDTEGDVVNAIEGEMHISGDTLRIVEVRSGGSVLGLWLAAATHDDSSVDFSGIVPGGISGPLNYLFSIVVEGIGTGESEFTFDPLRILLHDGFGTEVDSRGDKFVMETTLEKTGRSDKFADATPPEPFTVHVVQSEHIHEGQYAAVFAAQDKGGGVSHYEVQESLSGEKDESKWQKASSPYLLQDQSRRSTIFVKAVDADGNARIVEIPPVSATLLRSLFVQSIALMILAVVMILILVWLFLLWKRDRKKEQMYA